MKLYKKISLALSISVFTTQAVTITPVDASEINYETQELASRTTTEQAIGITPMPIFEITQFDNAVVEGIPRRRQLSGSNGIVNYYRILQASNAINIWDNVLYKVYEIEESTGNETFLGYDLGVDGIDEPVIEALGQYGKGFRVEYKRRGEGDTLQGGFNPDQSFELYIIEKTDNYLEDKGSSSNPIQMTVSQIKGHDARQDFEIVPKEFGHGITLTGEISNVTYNGETWPAGEVTPGWYEVLVEFTIGYEKDGEPIYTLNNDSDKSMFYNIVPDPESQPPTLEMKEDMINIKGNSLTVRDLIAKLEDDVDSKEDIALSFELVGEGITNEATINERLTNTVGEHQIKVKATDSDNNTTEAEVTVSVHELEVRGNNKVTTFTDNLQVEKEDYDYTTYGEGMVNSEFVSEALAIELMLTPSEMNVGDTVVLLQEDVIEQALSIEGIEVGHSKVTPIDAKVVLRGGTNPSVPIEVEQINAPIAVEVEQINVGDATTSVHQVGYYASTAGIVLEGITKGAYELVEVRDYEGNVIDNPKVIIRENEASVEIEMVRTDQNEVTYVIRDLLLGADTQIERKSQAKINYTPELKLEKTTGTWVKGQDVMEQVMASIMPTATTVHFPDGDDNITYALSQQDIDKFETASIGDVIEVTIIATGIDGTTDTEKAMITVVDYEVNYKSELKTFTKGLTEEQLIKALEVDVVLQDRSAETSIVTDLDDEDVAQAVANSGIEDGSSRVATIKGTVTIDNKYQKDIQFDLVQVNIGEKINSIPQTGAYQSTAGIVLEGITVDDYAIVAVKDVNNQDITDPTIIVQEDGSGVEVGAVRVDEDEITYVIEDLLLGIGTTVERKASAKIDYTPELKLENTTGTWSKGQEVEKQVMIATEPTATTVHFPERDNHVTYSLSQEDIDKFETASIGDVIEVTVIATGIDGTIDQATAKITVVVGAQEPGTPINHPPVITASDVTIVQGEAFDPLNHEAIGLGVTDKEDTDITLKAVEVVKNGVADNNGKVGTWEVVYKATDKEGAVSYKSIYVTIIPALVTPPPVITPINHPPVIIANDVTITQGEVFDPLNHEAIGLGITDKEDTDITLEAVEVVKDGVKDNEGKVGTWEVVYKATDSGGAVTYRSIFVTIEKAEPETTPPTPETTPPTQINTRPVVSAANLIIPKGHPFNPINYATAEDKEDGTIPVNASHVIYNDVDIHNTGEYTVTYKVVDSGKVESEEVSITVTVVEAAYEDSNHIGSNGLPVIIANHLIVEKNSVFNAIDHAKAYDKEDGVLEVQVLESTVNTSNAGIYSVTYSAVDSDGNETIKTITVAVIDSLVENANQKPIIITNDVVLARGTTFDPLNHAFAHDIEDGVIEITLENVLENTVNTNAVGTYQVTYQVEDSQRLKSNPVTMNVYVVNSGGQSSGGGGHYTGNSIVDAFIDHFGLGTTEYLHYIDGYEDGTFRPHNQVTRGEFVLMVARILLNGGQVPEVPLMFTDVTENYFAHNAISFLTQAQVIQGYPDGTFRPNDPISRGEIAVILARLNALGTPIIESEYSDLEKEHWAYEAIQQVSERSWLVGYEGNLFKPDENMTRVETVTVLNRIYRAGYTFDEAMYVLGFSDVSTLYWGYEDILKASVTHSAAFEAEEESINQ